MKRAATIILLFLALASLVYAQPVARDALDSTLRQVVYQLLTLNATVAKGIGVVPTTWGRPFPVTVMGFQPALDPCFLVAKGGVAISQTATTRLVVGLPGQRIFVCAARVVAAVAEIPSFIEGTGTACATGASAVSGSTTAANGESYAANGGFAAGGPGAIMVTNKPGDDLCLQQSGAQRLSGNIVYAFVQP